MNIFPVCTKSVSGKCNSIQYDICNLWIPQFKCSGLNRKQFEDICKPNSDSLYCPNCIITLFPFSNLEHVAISNQQNNSILSNNLSDELKSLLSDLYGVVTGLTASDDDQDEFDIQFHSNSCGYLNCSEFNSIISKTPTNFSATLLLVLFIGIHQCLLVCSILNFLNHFYTKFHLRRSRFSYLGTLTLTSSNVMTSMGRYRVEYSAGSEDYIGIEEIDGVEMILLSE